MATGIRDKDKDRMPTRRPMVSRTPGGRFITDVSRNVATGIAEGAKSTVTDYRNAINAVENRAKPVATPLRKTGNLTRAGMMPKEDQIFKGARKAGDAIRKGAGVAADYIANPPPPRPVDMVGNDSFLSRHWGPNSPIKRGIKAVMDPVKSFFSLPYSDSPSSERTKAPTQAKVDVPLAAAPEETKGPATNPLAARTEAATADPKKWTPDFQKPLWWMDDRIPNDRKPIHAIRGTQQSWWSPNTGIEYASPREAYEGMTEEQRISASTKFGEQAHELQKEMIKGQYGVEKAKLYAQDNQKGRFQEVEGFYDEGQGPQFYDTWTGQQTGASEIASQLNAQTEMFANMPEERAAQLLAQLSESEATQVLRGMQASRAQKILDVMDNLKTTPKKKQ